MLDAQRASMPSTRAGDSSLHESLLGVFIFGKAWFTVVAAMCLGAPFVTRLARDCLRFQISHREAANWAAKADPLQPLDAKAVRRRRSA